MNLKQLNSQVLHCLEHYPDSRNSDIVLTKLIWSNFYSDFLEKRGLGLFSREVVSLDNLFNLPTQDSIKRIRARIQNQKHEFLPTSAEVARQRRWREEDWRGYLGYNPELRQI